MYKYARIAYQGSRSINPHLPFNGNTKNSLSSPPRNSQTLPLICSNDVPETTTQGLLIID